MRLRVLLLGFLAASAASVVTLAVLAAEAAPRKCLMFRDLQTLSRVDDKTLIAHTRTAQKYTVTLRHPCRQFGDPGNYYTVRLHSTWECLDRDDVLVFHYGGACFIESVTPA